MALEIKILKDSLTTARPASKTGNASQLLFPIPQTVPGYYSLGHVALLNASGVKSPGSVLAK